MKFLNFLLPLVFLSACQPESPEAEKASSTDETLPAIGIVIETNKGTIEADLYPSRAPITVENFLSYVDKNHYDNTAFHRIMSDFMIQGGGFYFDSGILTEKPTGSGITNESQQGDSNKRGTLAMARTNAPNSATAQFFINVVDNERLDYPNAQGHGYAVFGKVTKGMDVVDTLKEVEVGITFANSLLPDGLFRSGEMQNVPVEPTLIKSIRRAAPSE